jgi:hypothetical protein
MTAYLSLLVYANRWAKRLDVDLDAVAICLRGLHPELVPANVSPKRLGLWVTYAIQYGDPFVDGMPPAIAGHLARKLGLPVS